MMPWAGSLFYRMSRPLFARWESRESRLQSVLRRAAVLPILLGGPLFVLLHLYAPPQHVGIGHRCRTGAIGYFWPHRTGAMQDRGYRLPRIPLIYEHG
jgi:hypothetical protein